MDWIFETFEDNFKMNNISSHSKNAVEFIKKLYNEFDLKLIVTKNKVLAAKWLIDNNAENLVNCLVSEKKYCQLYLNNECIKHCKDFSKFYKVIIELKNSTQKMFNTHLK